MRRLPFLPYLCYNSCMKFVSGAGVSRRFLWVQEKQPRAGRVTVHRIVSLHRPVRVKGRRIESTGIGTEGPRSGEQGMDAGGKRWTMQHLENLYGRPERNRD